MISKVEHDKILDFCNSYNIENFVINRNGVVDVDGSVNIQGLKSERIPISFGIVTGDFNCNDSKSLIDLEGSPKIVGGSFYCISSELNTIKGCPENIGNNFALSINNIKKIDFFPKEIGGSIYLDHNYLDSLDGSPKVVNGGFFCSVNNLKSLKGGPVSVVGEYAVGNNPLESLEGCASSMWVTANNCKLKSIDGCDDTSHLDVSYNFIYSIKKLPKNIQTIRAKGNPVDCIIKLFKNLDYFNTSLDYGYFRNKSIIESRFREALNELDITLTIDIRHCGYFYI